MIVTFTVESIEYTEGGTTLKLRPGIVAGAERMGQCGELSFFGCSPIHVTPGNVIRVTIEDTGERRAA